MVKEFYAHPEVEIVEFDAQDIIRTSPDGPNPEEGETPVTPG